MNVPEVVIRPILLPYHSVNHRFPSGPPVIYKGPLGVVGMVNSVKVPVVETLPILPLPFSANHMLPSGPAAMPSG